jgi:hypothetical protein
MGTFLRLSLAHPTQSSPRLLVRTSKPSVLQVAFTPRTTKGIPFAALPGANFASWASVNCIADALASNASASASPESVMTAQSESGSGSCQRLQSIPLGRYRIHSFAEWPFAERETQRREDNPRRQPLTSTPYQFPDVASRFSCESYRHLRRADTNPNSAGKI